MQLISNKKGFTILELLVVLAVMGVFTAIAYPNISSWITDREVKKEVYETVTFIKERKAEVTSGKYGMTQIVLKPNLEVYTMSPQNFFNTYQNISSSSSYKTNKQCDYASRQSGFSRNSSLETLSFPINVSEVQVYPNGAHNPSATYLCITKDASIKFMQLRKTDRDPDTNQNVDMFVFCSNSNTTQNTCKFDANYDFMYKLNIDNFQNIKVYKKNKNKNSWMKIDG